MAVLVDFETYGIICLIGFIILIIIYFATKSNKYGFATILCPYCNKEKRIGIYTCENCNNIYYDEDKIKIIKKTYKYIINDKNVNIYGNMDFSEDCIFSLNRDEVVTLNDLGKVITDYDRWVNIITTDGKNGWCSSEYLSNIKK